MKYAFINGKILDGKQDMEPREGLVLLTEGEKIREIKKAGGEEGSLSEKGYQLVDLKGAYLMPGLINLHVHLAGNGKVSKKPRDNAKFVKKLFANALNRRLTYSYVAKLADITLNSGVTTIRTVGGLKDLDSRLRDEIMAGKRRGPRILAADEAISVPGGHMAGSVAVACKSVDEALEVVDKNLAQGVDLIKLMITGGVLDAKKKGGPGELKMPPEMVKAVCDAAHKNGLIVSAHVESTEGLVVALENGVDSIEHGAVPTDEVIRLFKEKGSFLVTTLSPALPFALFDREISHASEMAQYNGKIVFDGIQECSKAALANGIPVGLGNDVGCPWITQYDFWRELQYFHKFVGVSRKFALHTATEVNAKLAGLGDVTGTLEAGKSADMIVTEANPLNDLQALREVKLVMARGRLLDKPKVKRKPELDKELDKYC